MPIETKFSRRSFLILLGSSGLIYGLFLSKKGKAKGVNWLFETLPLKDDFIGKETAPVTVITYASMTCSHCKSFHDTVMPMLKEKYINTGKVKLILRPFPFDGDHRGEAAFMLAKCTPNGNYYAMIDALFSTQSVWARKENPVPEFLRLAKLAGMSEENFNDCLSDQNLLKKIIQSRQKAVADFNVRSTPTIFVNNHKLRDFKLETVMKAIDDSL
ncbi:DsbA family protein [Candidatus Endowatersipora endosymbiont of Watersipora subatra]|uniref:DsbA family protein n=1 Tax=Candidatus Endowatersipora endosymbiont of Watersipora subatra TaxID=3077946 RepID=UPI00312C8B60